LAALSGASDTERTGNAPSPRGDRPNRQILISINHVEKNSSKRDRCARVSGRFGWRAFLLRRLVELFGLSCVMKVRWHPVVGGLPTDCEAFGRHCAPDLALPCKIPATAAKTIFWLRFNPGRMVENLRENGPALDAGGVFGCWHSPRTRPGKKTTTVSSFASLNSLRSASNKPSSPCRRRSSAFLSNSDVADGARVNSAAVEVDLHRLTAASAFEARPYYFYGEPRQRFSRGPSKSGLVDIDTLPPSSETVFINAIRPRFAFCAGGMLAMRSRLLSTSSSGWDAG